MPPSLGWTVFWLITSSHPRVVVLQVGAHLLADALPVGVSHARQQRVVERDLAEVAGVVHEPLALELLEGVSQHGVAHGAPVAKKLRRVRAARSVDRQPTCEPVAVEGRVAVEHAVDVRRPRRGVHALQERQQERHLVRERVVALLEEGEEVVADGLVVVHGDLQALPYGRHVPGAEEVHRPAAEGERHARLDAPAPDPAVDRARVHEEVPRHLLDAEPALVPLRERGDLHGDDALHALADAVDLHPLARLVVAAQHVAERHVVRVLEDGVQRTGPHHGPVLVHHVDDEHVALRARAPQATAELLQVEHAAERGAGHHEDPELRIIPALRYRLAAAEEADATRAEVLHDPLDVARLPADRLRGYAGAIEKTLHLPGMAHVHAKDDPLAPAGRSFREVAPQHVHYELVARGHADGLLQVGVDVLAPVDAHAAEVDVRLDAKGPRRGDDALLHRLGQREAHAIGAENLFEALLVRALVGGGEADEKVGVEVLDGPLEGGGHGVVCFVDDDVGEVVGRELRVVPTNPAVRAYANAFAQVGEGVEYSSAPVLDDGRAWRADKGLHGWFCLRETGKVFEHDVRLARAGGKNRQEALCAVGATLGHLFEGAFLVLVELEGSVDHDARIDEVAGSGAKEGADVILEPPGEADVLGGEAEELDAEALAGVLLEELLAIALRADNLRVVIRDAVLLDAKNAALGADGVVDEAGVAVEVGDAVLAGEEALTPAAVDVGKMLLELSLKGRGVGKVRTVGRTVSG